LLLKFRLKLFDNPFVDADKAARVVGAPEARQAGELAQREAMVLLQNRHGVLPAAAHGQKVWVFGIDRAAAAAAGFTVVERPEDADLIVIRTNAPHEILHPHHFFGARQNEGSLDFAPDDPAMVALARASGRAPVVFVINLDRPAILTSIKPQADVLLATFGASDAAVLDVITGRARAKGRLPVELPSSMAAVRAQDPARPDDSAQPLFPRGFSASR
jgi:beta-glucosidase